MLLKHNNSNNKTCQYTVQYKDIPAYSSYYPNNNKTHFVDFKMTSW